MAYSVANVKPNNEHAVSHTCRLCNPSEIGLR